MAAPFLSFLFFFLSLNHHKEQRYSYDTIHNCSRSSQKIFLFLLARPVAFRLSPVLPPLARRIRSQSAPASIASLSDRFLPTVSYIYTHLSLTRDKLESNTEVATYVT